MEQETKAMFELVLKKLGGFDQRFDGVDTQLDGIGRRFDGVDTQLDAIDRRFDGVDTQLDAIDRRFDGVDTRLDGIDRRFDRLEAMGKSNGDLTVQLLKMVGSVNASLDEVKESVKSLEANQSLVEKRLNVQRDDLATVRERIGILEQEKH